MQVDPVFEGLEGGPGTLIKYNPLSNVSSSEVWNFLRAMVRLTHTHMHMHSMLLQFAAVIAAIVAVLVAGIDAFVAQPVFDMCACVRLSI